MANNGGRSIEAVIINWKRPENVAQIVEALERQSVPCTITICDCHPEPRFALPDRTRLHADRIYHWHHNTGPYSRFVPLASYDHEFTLFLDDDMLPGDHCARHFLDCAGVIRRFGVLGQLGRIVAPSGEYLPRHVPRGDGFVEVDIVIRGYFVRTRHLPLVADLRWRMNHVSGPLPVDDLLLCVAMGQLAGLPCYLTPADADPETRMNRRELPQPYSLSGQPDHLKIRTTFLRDAQSIGWVPLQAR
jgi:hypothetical protein